MGSTLQVRETEGRLEWQQPRQQRADVSGRKAFMVQSFVGHKNKLGFYSKSNGKLLEVLSWGSI